MALADATILHQLKIHYWIVVEYIPYFLLQMAAVQLTDNYHVFTNNDSSIGLDMSLMSACGETKKVHFANPWKTLLSDKRYEYANKEHRVMFISKIQDGL